MDMTDTRSVMRYIEAKMTDASIVAGKLASAGDRGLLLNWYRRKCRLAASVEWQHFDDFRLEDDQSNGVLGRGQR